MTSNRLLLLLLVVAVACAVPVSRRSGRGKGGGDSGDDSGDDHGNRTAHELDLDLTSRSVEEENEPVERRHRLNAKVRGRNVEIESRHGDDDDDDSNGSNHTKKVVKFSFDSEEYPKIQFKFAVNGTETRVQLGVRRVFHFTPAGDVTLGYGGEAQRNVLDLSTANWTLTCATVAADFTGVYSCISRTSDNKVVIKVQLSGTTFVKNGVQVRPNQAKIQVVINHPAADTDAIGLQVKLRTKTEFETREDNGAGAVALGDSAFFEWETTFLDENNVSHPVVAKSIAEDSDDDGDEEDDDKDFVKTFTFASLGAQAVNWDPVFGESSSGASGDSSLSTGAVVGIAVGAVAGVVLVVVLVVAIMSKRSLRA